jgi:hypothetical protein
MYALQLLQGDKFGLPMAWCALLERTFDFDFRLFGTAMGHPISIDLSHFFSTSDGV